MTSYWTKATDCQLFWMLKSTLISTTKEIIYSTKTSQVNLFVSKRKKGTISQWVDLCVAYGKIGTRGATILTSFALTF
jgi:hypothetical protein